jgi:hypothetical protein
MVERQAAKTSSFNPTQPHYDQSISTAKEAGFRNRKQTVHEATSGQ